MKKTKLFLMSAFIAATMSFTSLAGTWQSDSAGWWYQNDDGSYPVNTWQWIDGNNDGIAESYYFDANGYCLMNTTTPDGYIVDSNGAWIVNGTIQTQTVNSVTGTPETSVATETTQSAVPVGTTVWVVGEGKKYHSDPTCSNMKNPQELSLDEAISRGKTPCSKCY